MVNYKTVYCSSETIDANINELTKRGWTIKFITYCGDNLDGRYCFALTFEGQLND